MRCWPEQWSRYTRLSETFSIPPLALDVLMRWSDHEERYETMTAVNRWCKRSSAAGHQRQVPISPNEGT